MRLLVFVGCFGLLAAGMSAQKAAAKGAWVPTTGPAALVNGEEISVRELLESIWMQSGEQALNSMVDQVLIRQASKKAKTTAAQKDVEDRIAQITQGLPKSEIIARLKQAGRTYDQFYRDVETRVLLEKTVGKTITIESSELDSVSARHLQFDVKQGKDADETAANEAAAKAKAEEAMKKLNEGGDFEAIAKEMSDDGATKNRGGQLGNSQRNKGRFRDNKEIQDLLFSLEPGKLSEIKRIVNPAGAAYHIFRVDTRQLYRDLKPDEQKRLMDSELQSRISMKLPQWFDEQRKKAKIVKKVTFSPPAPKATKNR